MEPLRTRTLPVTRLLWKEWHEQRWKLGFGCLLLGAFALIGLRSRAFADEAMVSAVCFLAAALLPVLSSTGLVPAERAEGTLAALLALPVPAWQVLAAKTAAGVGLCAGPLVAAAAVSLAVAGGREMSAADMLGLFARTLAATLSLFAWMLALTVRLPTEARAGMLSLGVLVAWLLVTAGEAGRGVPDWLWAASPSAFTFDARSGAATLAEQAAESHAARVAAAVVQPIVAAALWLWAARRLRNSAEDRP